MKKILLLLSLCLFSYYSYSQCAGASTTGQYNACRLRISIDSQLGTVTSGLWNGTAISLGYGGTGATTANGALNNLLPVQSSSTNRFLMTDGTNSSWQIPSVVESDPIWLSEKTNYWDKTQSDARYLQSFMESDPTVPSNVKAITGTNISNWNTSFGWGDHASAGYLTATSANTLTNKSGNISQWTNNSGYLTTVTSSQVTTALGYTPTNPNGSNTQYIAGDGSKITFPTIPTLTNQLTNNSGFLTSINSSQVTTALGYTPFNPSGSALQYIRGDGSLAPFPTIPTNNNQLTNGSGFVTNLSSFTTSNLTENINLYYTESRARLSNSAGTGITYNNVTGVITNSSPDQTVVLTSGTGINTSGTYPSFTVTNTAPDQTVSITGSNITVSGTYPSFTIGQKKTETYTGTTIAAGTYTVTYPVAYSVAPNVQFNINNGTDTQNIRLTSSTTTGFTVIVRNRVDVVGLLPTWVNVSGAVVDVLVTEK